MFVRFWAHKENIFYTILTIFLLERVRRGWNRISARGRLENLSEDEIEKKQQTYTFGAALLYALPFLLPTVKYIYGSIGELSRQVPGLTVLNNVWAFAVILVAAEALLAIVIYNLLGIYVERMNGALGFFRKLGRSVIDGSKVAVHNVRADTASRLAKGVRLLEGASSTVYRHASAFAGGPARRVREGIGGARSNGGRYLRRAKTRLGRLPVLKMVRRPGTAAKPML